MHTRSFCTLAALVAAATLATLTGCASSGKTDTTTKDEQTAMSPDQALARLREGNERFVAGKRINRDYTAQRETTSHGQAPFACVLACIDSRCAPEIVFDQGIGDIFAPRDAGNYALQDTLGGMEFATKVTGSKLIVVLGHTECGAVKGACDNVQLGNLTSVIYEIRPAVEDVKTTSGDRSSKNKQFVYDATVSNVRRTVEKIRRDSPIIRELEQTGQVKIVGAMHDISTGAVTFLN